MKYRFLRKYEHRWPSGAHTHFLAGAVCTLKREVIERATAKGAIEPVKDDDSD